MRIKILSALSVIALIVVAQNMHEVQIHVLWWKLDIMAQLLMLLLLLIGFLLGYGIRYWWQYRYRRHYEKKIWSQ